jgi:hypothetical protein
VAINPYKTVVLNKHLETADPAALNSDDLSGGDRHDGGTDRRRQVNAIMISSGERFSGQKAWSKRRGNASGPHRR